MVIYIAILKVVAWTLQNYDLFHLTWDAKLYRQFQIYTSLLV